MAWRRRPHGYSAARRLGGAAIWAQPASGAVATRASHGPQMAQGFSIAGLARGRRRAVGGQLEHGLGRRRRVSGLPTWHGPQVQASPNEALQRRPRRPILMGSCNAVRGPAERGLLDGYSASCASPPRRATIIAA